MINFDKHLINKFKISLLVEKGLSKNTLSSYVTDILNFMDYFDKPVKDIVIEDYYKYIDVLSDLGLAKSTLARKRISIKSFFIFLKNENIDISLNYEDLPVIKYNNHIPEIISVEDMLFLLDNLPGRTALDFRTKVIFEFLYGTGVRVSELIAIKTYDVRFEEKIVLVKGKGSKYRYIPLNDNLVNLLEMYMRDYRKILLKDKINDFIFINRFGKPLSRMGVWKIIRTKIELMEINVKISPHIFRHSYATHLLEGGANLRIVQELLGHSSINTTQIYTNIDTQHIKDVYSLCHPRTKRYLTKKNGKNI